MLTWLVLAAGLIVYVAVVSGEVYRLTAGLRRPGGAQYERHEVGQSLPADVLGFMAELLLWAFLVCAPSAWAPSIIVQTAGAVVELGYGEPGYYSMWLGGKLVGGLTAYVLIRYRVGNFKHPH